MNKGFTVRLPEEDVKQFNRQFPGLLSKYIQKCVSLALIDVQNFDSIFFANRTNNLVINLKEENNE